MQPVGTFGAMLDTWIADIDRRVDLSPRTPYTYRRRVEHLNAWGRDLPLGRVDLTEYVKLRQRLGYAPRTIALDLRIAGAAFRWAQRHHLVVPEASIWIPRVKIDPKAFVLNHSTPTPQEAGRAIAAMREDDWKLAVKVIARTGARVGEVVSLRGRDLDEVGKRVAFGAVRGASKTGLRWFPLDQGTLRELKGRSARDKDPLFDFGEVRGVIQALERRLYRACQSAEVPAFTPHGLRRMVVNRLIRAHVDPGTAAALTGHSIQVMLRFYQQVTPQDARAAVDLARLGEL